MPGGLPRPFPTLPYNTTDRTISHQLLFSQYSIICLCRQLLYLNPRLAGCLNCRNGTTTAQLLTLCQQNPAGVLGLSAEQFVSDAMQFLIGPMPVADPIFGPWWNRSASYFASMNPTSGGTSNDINEISGRRVSLTSPFPMNQINLASSLATDRDNHRLHPRRLNRMPIIHLARSLSPPSILFQRTHFRLAPICAAQKATGGFIKRADTRALVEGNDVSLFRVARTFLRCRIDAFEICVD